jgi:glycosylphosphatidylinositol transamidase
MSSNPLRTADSRSTDSQLIKSFSLLALGICLSTLSTLNFSLGFFVGVICSPLAFIQPTTISGRRTWITVVAVIVMQLVSPLNWFYLVSRQEFGQGVSELALMYLFAWKVWGAWTPLVWWCIWWPAWVAGLVVLAAPS